MNRTILHRLPAMFERVESAAGGFRRQRARRSWSWRRSRPVILRRDSAATRHLVWLLAIVAMLVVPVLSATVAAVASAAGVGGYFAGADCSRRQAPARSPGPADGADGIAAECGARGRRVGHPRAANQPRRNPAGFRGPRRWHRRSLPASPAWSWNWVKHCHSCGQSVFACSSCGCWPLDWMLWKLRTARDGHLVVKAARESNPRSHRRRPLKPRVRSSGSAAPSPC